MCGDDRGPSGVHAPWTIAMPLYRRIDRNMRLSSVSGGREELHQGQYRKITPPQ
jgi:hypothetical protein